MNTLSSAATTGPFHTRVHLHTHSLSFMQEKAYKPETTYRQDLDVFFFLLLLNMMWKYINIYL
uniref:Uncharacterized protein n=1 Tax=Anguilla anguilla TaxID=7936 RepID=A0A0E9PL09_ANGAN